MYAIAGTMRSGATRSGYYRSRLILLIDGVDRVANLWQRTLQIQQLPNEQPDTASLTLFDTTGTFVPVCGQTLIVSDANPTNRLFAGTIVKITHRSVRAPAGAVPAISLMDLSVIDWTWMLNRRTITTTYPVGSEARAVFIDIWQRASAPHFTAASVQQDGPLLTGTLSFHGTKIADAFTQLCQATAPNWFWYVDAECNLHYFSVEAKQRPSALAPGNLTYDDLNYTLDISQIRTRILCEGGGGGTTAPVNAGATAIPVDECGWYSASGGTALTPQNVIITYTGLSALSGEGSLTGVSGLTLPMLQSDQIHVWTVVNDVAAQTALGLLERDQLGDATDGIHEELISNGNHNLAQITQAGLAELAALAAQNITGHFVSRDRHMRVGKQVAIRLPNRAITADVTIQEVTRTLYGPSLWQYDVTFGLIWRNLVDVLNRI